MIHLGAGKWATVDSFATPGTRQPIALDYLDSIGVAPSALEFVIATHWDQDHITGVAALADAAPRAKVMLSLALESPDFMRLAFRHQQRTFASQLGSGTKEFVKLLDLLMASDRRPEFAMQDRTLFNRNGVRLVALSPASAASLDALSAATVAALEGAATGDSVVEPTPNAASLVLAIRRSCGDILLGADLERAGWTAAVNAVEAQGLAAEMFKVPHHGSSDADDEAVWRNLLAPNAHYAVTRFNNGDRSLPTDADRVRMRDRNPAGHVVGAPSVRLHLHGMVGRRVRAATLSGVWRVTGPVGHYRWRRAPGAAAGSVTLAGAVETV